MAELSSTFAMAPTAGSWLTETLELQRPLGNGAMSTVWIAFDHGRGEHVAVKLATPTRNSLARDARFRREMSVTSEIDSPFVPKSYESGVSSDGTPYLVMELLDGETLEARLLRERTLSLADTATLVEQLAHALDCVHAVHLIHRDVKPENIFLLVGYDGLFAKLIDFGVAKPCAIRDESSLTEAGAMVGTPDYMSPEQMLGSKDIDHRTDLWGLGVVAYRALTGTFPFVRPSAAALVLAICRATYSPATSVNTELPGAIDGWFARSLCVRPEARFASAGEMAAALAALARSPG